MDQMHPGNEPEQELTGRSQFSRRDALKRGAVGGALLWSVPTLSVIGASRASADEPSVISPPPPPPPPPGDEGCGAPSHGLVVFTIGGVTYGAKVDAGGVDKPGAGERAWLESMYPGISFDFSGVTGGLVGDHLSITVPNGSTILVAAYAVDGNFDDSVTVIGETPNGQEYAAGVIVGNTANFYKSYDCDPA